MPIPNADRAVIDPAKLYEYVLSTTHPVGRFKAIFFARLGYTSADWRRLEIDLRTQHLLRDPETEERGAYGRKFKIRATLRGPTGIAEVVSIWFIPLGDEVPRFVTAYPGGGI